MEMVQTIMGRDCLPVAATTFRSMPKPSSTTAACKMILDVHLMPGSALPLSVQSMVITIPSKMAMTAPPITGNSFPQIQAGMAMARQTRIPFVFV